MTARGKNRQFLTAFKAIKRAEGGEGVLLVAAGFSTSPCGFARKI